MKKHAIEVRFRVSRQLGSRIMAVMLASVSALALATTHDEPVPPGPPSITSIMVKVTARCLVTIGGEHETLLDPRTSKTFFIAPGEYDVVAQDPESDRVVWRESVTLESGRIKVVLIELPKAEPPYAGPIFNGEDNLSWTREDNRADLTWEEAREHCSSITVGEFQDWRLPTAAELESLCMNQFNDPSHRSSAIERPDLAVWTKPQADGRTVQVIILEPGCESVELSPSMPAGAVCVRGPQKQ